MTSSLHDCHCMLGYAVLFTASNIQVEDHHTAPNTVNINKFCEVRFSRSRNLDLENRRGLILSLCV